MIFERKTYMKYFLTGVCFIFFSHMALAQQPAVKSDSSRTAMNAVYLMFIGSGLHVSLHYERFITNDISIHAGIGTAGFNYSPEPKSPDNVGYQWVPVLPFSVNYFIGEGKDRLELGIGGFMHLSDYGREPMFPDLSSSKVKGTLTIGYRYQPLNGNFNAGIGITPVFDSQHIEPWMGLYLGYGF